MKAGITVLLIGAVVVLGGGRVSAQDADERVLALNGEWASRGETALTALAIIRPQSASERAWFDKVLVRDAIGGELQRSVR